MASIKREMAGFQPDEQEELGRQIASYLRRVRNLREALKAGEEELERSEGRSLADLDETIARLRRRHAG